LRWALRRLLFTLTIPTVLSGCAHEPRIEPAVAQAPAGSGKRVFRVGASPAAHRLDTYAASLPELADSFSSTAIIEQILARRNTISATPPSKTSGRGTKHPAPAQYRRSLAAAAVKTGSKMARRSRGHSDYWEAVRSRLVLSAIEHEAVAAQLEQLRQHSGAVDFLMKRAEPYLQYLLEEINRHGLPTDLVLVPMVESAFEASALSPKQAAGLWQFIPTTGQQYGLEVSGTYDGRYDVHASTQAALKYLAHLNHLFNGDWLLALAAYNAGEGAVQRAIEANKKAGGSGSFWELDLPAETEAYVLKILSLAHVLANPEAHGLKLRKLSAEACLTRVEVGADVSLTEIVASSGLAPELFYKLNPAFKPDVPPPSRTYNFLIPLDKAQALASKLASAKIYAARKVVVKKGETLSILAKRHGVPEVKLAEWNGLKPKAVLKAGQELLVFPV
jgi:membrane-bound lytic murein transglycosylase D